MKNKINKLILLLFCIFSGCYIVLADTGFDIDYDIGGGGGGGYSSGGGFIFGGTSSNNDAVGFIYTGVLIASIIIWIIRYIGKKTTDKDINAEKLVVNHANFNKVTDVWLDNIDTKIPDLDKEKFTNMVCEKYIKLQEAWVNFDYDTIRKLTTDDLYNSYKSMLESLKRKKQRNIIDDITIYDCTFKNFKEENGKYSMDVVIGLAMRDYIVNTNSVIIARGMDVRLDVTTVITLVSTVKDETTKCPVCGAELDKDNQSGVCKFCHNTIVKENYGWLIAKKKITKQKVIDD